MKIVSNSHRQIICKYPKKKLLSRIPRFVYKNKIRFLHDSLLVLWSLVLISSFRWCRRWACPTGASNERKYIIRFSYCYCLLLPRKHSLPPFTLSPSLHWNWDTNCVYPSQIDKPSESLTRKICYIAFWMHTSFSSHSSLWMWKIEAEWHARTNNTPNTTSMEVYGSIEHSLNKYKYGNLFDEAVE